jgi:uncharacterized membrane protein
MLMPPGLRKFVLTLHVITSVGWLGAVAAFLALAVVGLEGRDTETLRSAYLAMDLAAWYVIVPLSFASPVTGLVQSLGTSWGLFRHYWVLVKLLITLPSTFLLMVHMGPIDHVAGMVMGSGFSGADLHGMRLQLLIETSAALLVLLVATILSVYKPKGMTRYGWRKQYAGPAQDISLG